MEVPLNVINNWPFRICGHVSYILMNSSDCGDSKR